MPRHSPESAPDGTVVRADDRAVLRYERWLDHPRERVWRALTEPHELRGWLADADVELCPGGTVELRWLNTDHEGNSAVARGTISELDPPRLLEIDTDLHGLLRWELEDDGDGTLLTFTNVSPAPPDMLSLVLAGWHIHLDHLEATLVGQPVDWPHWDRDHLPRWEQHKARYQAQFRG